MRRTSKIGIVYPSGHLYAAPAIQAAIELLFQHGYMVDVLMVKNLASPKVSFDNPKITVSYFPWRQNRVKEHKLLLTLLFVLWIIKRSLNNKYDFLFAVGERGLLSTVIPSILLKTPFAYYCLEIVFKDKNGKLRNLLAGYANSRAEFTTIQDSQRAKLLIQEHGIALDKTVIVPNARAGKAERITSHYLHDRYKIEDEKSIILCAGGMMRQALIKELVSSAQEWPEGWVLVVHAGIIYDEIYLREVLSANCKKRVIFSLSPISTEEMDELVSSADIGLAFYDKNKSLDYENIGLASGKIAQYLRNGVPIIVNNIKSLERIVNRYRIGVVVENGMEIPQAMKLIAKNHLSYVNNCLTCYNDLLSPDRYFEEVVKHIGATLKRDTSK